MQNEPEGKRTFMSLLRKVPAGDGRRRKLGEAAGSVKKYLVTTLGRKLDMRSWEARRSPAVRQMKESPITRSRRPGRDNNDVVHIYCEPPFINEVPKDLVCHGLEACQCIAHAKGHYDGFI